MIVVNYSNQLREAFDAGKRAGAAPFIAQRIGGEQGAEWIKRTPSTCEEWLESISDRPQVARG